MHLTLRGPFDHRILRRLRHNGRRTETEIEGDMTVGEMVERLQDLPHDAEIEICLAFDSGVEFCATAVAVEAADRTVTIVAAEQSGELLRSPS